MQATTDQFVGTKIGRYRIEELLGRGRGTMVYRAFDPVVNRQVAIKILDPRTARDRGAVEAFLRDARVLAALRHPHILPTFEAGEHGKTAYFARQLTDGGTLRARLNEAGKLPLGEAAAILRPVAIALDYAHRQDLIHRNLRPTNILLTADGHVFVTDFTLPGKHHQSSAATTVINATDAPAYVSPEQARGGALDGRSDVYVLAVILYEALVGRPPFQLEGPDDTARAVINRHLQEEPPSPSGRNPAIGRQVELVLLRGLEKDPEKRYPTAAALFYALSEADEQDRSVRRQATTATTPRQPVAQPGVLPSAPAAPPAAITELDALLATLTDAAPAPETTSGTPAPATSASAAPPAANVADRDTAPAPPPTPAPRRPPRLAIGGGIAAVLLGLAVVIFALTRGGPGAPAEATQVVPAASAAAIPAAAIPAAPTAASSAPAASPPAAPSPAAQAAPSVAATATATPAASQRPSPVRREAIVYAESRAGSTQTSLVAVGPDGKDRRTLLALPGHAWGPHIATDGRSIAYSVGSGASGKQTFAGGLAGEGQHDLYLANLDGSPPVRLTTTAAWNAGWSWSPDGTTLAFTSNRDGNWEIYLLTFPGQEIKRLTTNVAQDAWPNWTPDGKAIIFMSSRDGYPQIYRMDADGRNLARLVTSESTDSFPVISPNGRKIAYVTQAIGSPHNDIFVADIDGANATRLTDTGDNGPPAWSPDGTRLVFATNRDGNYNIYMVRADGTGLTRLTDTPGDEATPTWGTIELPAGSDGTAPGAQLPLGGMVALAVGPLAARRED